MELGLALRREGDGRSLLLGPEAVSRDECGQCDVFLERDERSDLVVIYRHIME
jgi:hypothetical protein